MCVLCGELIRSFHWTDGTDGSGSYENDENLKGQNALISANENARELKEHGSNEWDCSIKSWRFMG